MNTAISAAQTTARLGSLDHGYESDDPYASPDPSESWQRATPGGGAMYPMGGPMMGWPMQAGPWGPTALAPEPQRPADFDQKAGLQELGAPIQPDASSGPRLDLPAQGEVTLTPDAYGRLPGVGGQSVATGLLPGQSLVYHAEDHSLTSVVGGKPSDNVQLAWTSGRTTGLTRPTLAPDGTMTETTSEHMGACTTTTVTTYQRGAEVADIKAAGPTFHITAHAGGDSLTQAKGTAVDTQGRSYPVSGDVTGWLFGDDKDANHSGFIDMDGGVLWNKDRMQDWQAEHPQPAHHGLMGLI
ncbi:MAG TPA: hypothetical protein VGO93_25150, partial [Candidatus Xenobia bacterium]